MRRGMSGVSFLVLLLLLLLLLINNVALAKKPPIKEEMTTPTDEEMPRDEMPAEEMGPNEMPPELPGDLAHTEGPELLAGPGEGEGEPARKYPPPKPKPFPDEFWPTLGGKPPVVVARGGASMLFPDSSSIAFSSAIQQGADFIYCDMQITKEGEGICLKDVRLNNVTNVANKFPDGQKTLDLNGQPITGWFSFDYDMQQIGNISLIQSDYNRTYVFDDEIYIFGAAERSGLPQYRPFLYWVNVQYPGFYTANKHDPEKLVLDLATGVPIDTLSSPDIGFLKSIGGKIDKKTKLIFKCLHADEVEPSTKQPYGAILKDLASIKAFAAGIIVPKEFILPVNAEKLLQPPTTLVDDAHKAGLEIYASGFASDKPASYNYSYDPTQEYLHFIDKGFAVDGVITDSPGTAIQTINCIAHNRASKPVGQGPLIISHNGASGVYAGASDLAYQQAVDDGADVIDCSVQLSKDGVAFCFESPDLTRSTNAQLTFTSLATLLPEIQPKNGIFSFDLAASDIQSLKSTLVTPEETLHLPRHPENKNKGKIVTLTEFLDFAKAKAVSGVLIDIENAAYLASKKGLDVVDVVTKALANATLDKQATQQVFIQSDDTSVLSRFKDVTNYKKILTIKEDIGSVQKESLDEIKKFAGAVNLRRPSIIKFSPRTFMSIASTGVVKQMHSANISVYLSVLRNEFTVIPYDFYGDPYNELATYNALEEIDGYITDYPATASTFKRSPCSNNWTDVPYTFANAQYGDMLNLVPKRALPPAQAPAPPLKPADVLDPPLPDVQENVNSPADGSAGKAPGKSGQPANAVNLGQRLLFTMILSILSLHYYN